MFGRFYTNKYLYREQLLNIYLANKREAASYVLYAPFFPLESTTEKRS